MADRTHLLQLTAFAWVVRRFNGWRARRRASPVWSVATGGPGTITATGLFTAGTAVGLYTNPIIATAGSVQGTASVNVTATSSSRSRRP